MKSRSSFKREMPIFVSSILAALSIGFMVTTTSASDIGHANHIAPFIFAGIIGFWMLFLFIYPALANEDKSASDWE